MWKARKIQKTRRSGNGLRFGAVYPAFYYGLAHLHLSQDEVWLMPFGLLLDLWECHKQYNGQAVPAHEHYIDDIIPDGI